MARNKWYLRAGTAFQTNTNQSMVNNFGFDLEKYVKKELRHFNVNAHDVCCAAQIDVTADATVDQVERGLIYSLSPAAVSITLPDAVDFNEVQGKVKYFFVDNHDGDNAVTIVVGAGMVASSAVTGGTNLVVATGTVGKFQMYFAAPNNVKLSRLS